MRPYLAILADSFRAALASRVLWLALVAIWLLLAALAPIGYREDYTTEFRVGDFHNGTQLKALLARGLVDPTEQPKPIGRIAAAMPEDLQVQLRRVGSEEVRIRLSILADGLNECLGDESWYDAEAWRGTIRLKELRELDDTPDDQLTDSLKRRRARLRIEVALPGVFGARSPRTIIMNYFGMDFPHRASVDEARFVDMINQMVVPFIVDWLLGFILVLAGILVTSHLIPDMLQPGSLHLLLSKPVSRSLLFLSKFVGGCAFMTLCVTQLIIGLYLIIGFRLGVWNPRLLWCIPVAVFLFAVFYSVSAVVGLRWKSAIMATGVTMIFGLICFVVGFLGGLSDAFVTRPVAIKQVTRYDGTFVGSTRGGGVVGYDAKTNTWAEVEEGNVLTFDLVIPPVKLDPKHFATARVRGGRINPYGSGSLDLQVYEVGSWEAEPSLRLPTSTTRLYKVGDDGVLAMNSGLLAMTDTQRVLEAASVEVKKGEDDTEEDQQAKSEETTASWIGKLSSMIGSSTEGFETISPKEVSIAPPRSIAVDPTGDAIIVFSRGQLSRLVRPKSASKSGPWELAAETFLEGDGSVAVAMAVGDGKVLVARAEEPIRIVDANTFEPLAEIEIDSKLVVRQAASLGDSKFAVVTDDGYCSVVDAAQAKMVKQLSFGDVESISFEAGELVLVHDIDQIDVLDVQSWEVVQSIRPEISGWRAVDAYVVSPIRMVVPQTGRLGEIVAAMVSGKSSISIGQGPEEEDTYRYEVVKPVLSCAGFIVVMLTIGCVYFSTRDF